MAYTVLLQQTHFSTTGARQDALRPVLAIDPFTSGVPVLLAGDEASELLPPGARDSHMLALFIADIGDVALSTPGESSVCRDKSVMNIRDK